MFSLLGTLALGNLCPLRWLTAYLTACAEAGGKPPENATAFLPWNLSEEQRRTMAEPMATGDSAEIPNSS